MKTEKFALIKVKCDELKIKTFTKFPALRYLNVVNGI